MQKVNYNVINIRFVTSQVTVRKAEHTKIVTKSWIPIKRTEQHVANKTVSSVSTDAKTSAGKLCKYLSNYVEFPANDIIWYKIQFIIRHIWF